MTPMTRPEFNKKVRTLIKRVASPKNASIKLTKQTREILLYSFYFAIRYEDSIRHSSEMSEKINKAEECFRQKGEKVEEDEDEYCHEKALRKAAKVMGWTKGSEGKQSTRHSDKERTILSYFRVLRAFSPETSRKDAIEKTYKNFKLEGDDAGHKKLKGEVIEAKYDRREKYIKRLEKKYPDEITEEEANSLAPDPDRGFEELDRMIHELIIG
jgi:hypothetical protein